jgi:hypothetical protein
MRNISSSHGSKNEREGSQPISLIPIHFTNPIDNYYLLKIEFKNKPRTSRIYSDLNE